MEIDIPSKAFLGVRFVLFGFDPVNERKVRSKLVDGGGIDVGQYSQSCSHVIVDKLVYDDPVCVAARTDGKTLVTALWVDHSFDVGIPVDATSIMYRPLKDLNGIPGAQSLVMCLTGYQRQDREDIMTMVGLMGAHFSKPLVANKVTHLICYKFEGEKYELAKKIKKIKLVNHHWLEDCLRDWELLPEAKYDKSGYDLEMMEIEAKDSEEEAEDDTSKQFEGRDMYKGPHSLKTGMPVAHESPKSASEVPVVLPNSTVPADPSDAFNAKDMLSTPGRVTKSCQTSSFDNFNVPEVHGLQDIGASRNVVHETTPKSAKLDNDWTSTSKTAEKPSHSESKFNSISYTKKTPRKSPQKSVSLSKEVSGSVTHSPPANLGISKVNDVFDILSSKVGYPEARTGTDNIKTPQEGGDSCQQEESKDIIPQKRVTGSSGVSSMLKKISHIAQSSDMESLPVNYKSQVLESKSSVSHALENNEHFCPANKGHFRNEAANLNATVNSHVSASTASGTTFNKKLSTPHSIGTVTMETRINDNSDKRSPSPFKGSNESPLVSEPDIGDFGMRSSSLVGGAENMQNQPHHVEISFPSNRDLEKEKSNRPVTVDLPQGGNYKLVSKPVRMQKVGKKTLGTKHTANRKGSIYCNKSSSLNDPAACLSEGEERANEGKFSRAHEPESSPLSTCVAAAKEVDAKIVTECGNGSVNKTDSMNDETEAPDEKDELEFEKALNGQMAEVVELPDEEDIMMEAEHGVRNVAKDFSAGTDDDEMAAKKIIDGSELGKIVCGKKLSLDESTTKGEDMGGKIYRGKKRPLGKAKAKTVPADKKSMKLKKVVDGEGTMKEKKIIEDKVVPRPGSKRSGSTASASKLESCVEVEKENRPAVDGDQNSSQSVGKSVLKATKTTAKLNKKVVRVDSNSRPVGGVLDELKSEPLWFIFRGHRLQRKEFQQIVRRLKGRFCRDSHQWSYQATHFIAPDPLCRTEKFFGAAASGRWILKTDYLSACSQAGKFLAEEPYEWHKRGLSEDGAINLEAPRKWRLLRERTGHGAFYGMRIIVYGECIAPPLDTLKRVVKAGDGEILATSPPYTRFLKSGVDFAMVSPGMPRVDIWVQEFLKHEVPCVVADYLVEFVCKPGYPLEKHVLYNTHAWAEKSFANLVSRAEEVVLDPTPPNDSDIDSDNITCQVCGSADRGEVMLICGDESGSVGCGVGTHVDCCDPPLGSVPEEDWFCSKCTTRSSANPSKKKKK